MKILPYGTKVRDELTGVEGAVTAFCYYYEKSQSMYRIEYKSKNGALIEDWVLIDRLAPVKEKPLVIR